MYRLVYFFLALSTLAASVPELVDRMPRDPTAKEVAGICDELLAGGEASILALADLLTPETGRANTVFSALTRRVSNKPAPCAGYLQALNIAVADRKRPQPARDFLVAQMRSVIGSLALTPTADGLAIAKAYIDVPKVAAEAGNAAVAIGGKLGEASKQAVREVVSEAIIVCGDEQRKAGEALLTKLGGEIEPPSTKRYMGRQPAQTMHWMGADWLLRAVREREEATSVMIRTLDLQPGQVVADVGCGNGYHSLMMARLVGETGKIYGVDIQPEMLTMLKKRAAEAKVNNVVPVLGKFWDPNLPANTIDVALIVDAYHEFSHPARMLKGIYKALKPDGVVVFLEYRMEDPEVPIKRLHKMSKAQVDKELTANGFKRVKSFDDLPWQHMLWYGKE